MTDALFWDIVSLLDWSKWRTDQNADPDAERLVGSGPAQRAGLALSPAAQAGGPPLFEDDRLSAVANPAASAACERERIV